MLSVLYYTGFKMIPADIRSESKGCFFCSAVVQRQTVFLVTTGLTPSLYCQWSCLRCPTVRNNFVLQPLPTTTLIVKVPVIKMKRQQQSSESTKMGIHLTARAHQQYHHWQRSVLRGLKTLKRN